MAKNNDIDIELLAGLSEDTYSQIVNDIKDIQKRLEASGVKLKIDLNADDIMKKVASTENISAIKKTGVNLSKALIEQFGIVDKSAKEKIKSLSAELKNIRIGEIKTGTGNDALTTTMQELSNVVLNNANIIRERLGIYDEFYNYLKKISTIKISDAVKADLGDDWNTLRQVYSSKFSTTKGIELDSIYQELSTKFKDIFSGVSNPADQFREITTAIKNYRADVNKIEPLDASTLGLEDDVFSTIITELGKLDVVIKNSNLTDSVKGIKDEAQSMDDVTTAAKKASKEKENFAEANRDVARTAEDTAEAVNREQDAMMDMNDLDSILAGINLHGQQGANIFDSLGDSFRNAFSAYTLANLFERTLDKVVDAGQEAVETVADLNKEATSLMMATGADRSVINQYMTDYNALASDLGFLTADISRAADSYLRQGHDVADTNELIRDSLILSKVSELETADSTAYLTAIMKAYKLQAEEVIGVVDRLSAVDLSAAVDAGGIAEAMSKTAVSAQLAGVSIDQLISMVSVVGETSQDGMSAVGNAIRTIFSRMRDVRDGNLSSIGDDGTIEDLSNIEGTLEAVGIKLRESNNEFRNMYDVLDDTATKWSELSTVQKAAVGEAYSGVRQSEKFYILMENWDKVREYIEVSEQSTGISTEKFDAYLSSIEAHSNSLMASLERLATTTISDELYVKLLDIAKAMVDTASDTGILKSALIGLGTSASLYGIQQLVGFAHNAAQGFANLSEAMNITKAGNIGQTELQRLIDLTGGLSQSQVRLLISTNNLTDAQKISILVNRNLSQGMGRDAAEATARLQLQTWGLSSAQQGAARSAITLGSALKGTLATMAVNPIFLLTTAITVAVTAYQAFERAQEKIRENLEESVTSFESATDEVKSLETEIEQCTERLAELQKLADNGTISIADEKELELLKQTNDELERKLALKQAEQIEAQKEVLESNEKLLNTKETSKYSFKSDNGLAERVLPQEELLYAINAYDRGVRWLEENPDASDTNKSSTNKYIEEAKDRVSEMYKIISPSIEAYDKLIDAGYELEGVEKTRYEQLKKVQDAYLLYNYNLNGTKEAFQGLNTEQQKNILLNRLSEQGLSDIQVQAILRNISEDDYDDLWDEDFSFTPPEFTDYASAEEYGKAYAEAWLGGISDASSDTPQDVFTFDQESFNKQIKSYEDAYSKLIQAQEEYNETQAISPSNFVELQENGLLEYLEYTSDGLKVNTEKLLENAQTCKDKAVADLQAAMTSDMLGIAIGNTNNISDTAKSVIEQLGNNTETAGDKALNSVAEWATLGQTISSVLTTAGVEDINTDQWEQMSAVYDYYKNLADNISKIDITAPERKSGSGSKSKTKETFDWIETKLSRIQRTITNLGKTVSATWKNWSTRNNVLAQEMSTITHEIATQQDAMDAYMAKANSVGLSDEYKELKELIRNGGLRIDDETTIDDSTREKIKLYQEWYEKALDCEDAITDLQDRLASLAKTKFDNISKQYDDRIAMIEHHTSMLEGYVSRAEASGFWASEVYYQKMAEKELENINQLQGKYNDLTNALNESIANGSVERYSEQWYEMKIGINDVESALQEANTALVEFNQTLQQIHWDLFDRGVDYKNLFIEESNFLAELISRRDLYNEVGKLTAEGQAVQGLHAVNYNAYMEQSEAFAEEILKLNEEIANDPNDLELIDRRNELIGLQQEAIKNAAQEKDAIKDLVSNGYDVMLESLNKIIERNKTVLQSQKSLFDYEKQVSNQVDEIARLQKIIDAYSGQEGSEEAKTLVQKYTVDLKNAKDALAESEYERYIQDMEKLYDDLASDTETWINQRLDDSNGLVSEAIQATNDNATTISGTITDTAESLNVTLSEYTKLFWEGINDNTTLLLKPYEDVAKGIETGTTKLETVLGLINTKLQTMVDDLNAQATVEAETITQPEIEYNEINNYDTGNYEHSEPQQPTSSGFTFTGGTFYEDSYKGGKTGNSKNQWTGHEVEVTKESGTGMVHIVDKTTGTILGWVDKDQLQGYATGTTNAKKGFNLVSEKGDELIKDKDGNIILAKGEQIFPFKGGETVFNAAKTAELLNGRLMPLTAEQLWGNIVKTPRLPEMSHVQNRNVVNNFQMTFELPNVVDADSLITEFQHSKRFEKIVQSMTVDQMLGKGSLEKFRY